MIRRWLSAVVRSRSTASVTMLMAVSKPKVKSVTWQVVVDRLGDADDRQLVGSCGGGGRRSGCRRRRWRSGRRGRGPESWPSSGDVAIGDLERVGPRRAEDRAAAGDDAVGLGDARGDGSCPGSGPRQPSRMPTHEPPSLTIRCTTARITAFRPGQSPPPVNRPTFMVESRVGTILFARTRCQGLARECPQRARCDCINAMQGTAERTVPCPHASCQGLVRLGGGGVFRRASGRARPRWCRPGPR